MIKISYYYFKQDAFVKKNEYFSEIYNLANNEN